MKKRLTMLVIAILLLSSINAHASYDDELLRMAEAFVSAYPLDGFSRDMQPFLSTLGRRMHSNDARTVFNTAKAYAVLWHATGDKQHLDKALELFYGGFCATDWQRLDAWAGAIPPYVMGSTAMLVWDDLDAYTQCQAQSVIADAANRYARRQPASGYRGDTKAEENAWHSALFALAFNLMPNHPDAEMWATKARQFAYHSITTSSSPSYLGIRTQTVYDNFDLENHHRLNPVYYGGTIAGLMQGVIAYRWHGREVPWEFTHNIEPLLERYLDYVDFQDYGYLTGASWGTEEVAGFAGLVWFQADVMGIDTPLNDYVTWRRQNVPDGVTFYPTEPIDSIKWFDQTADGTDGQRWFLNSTFVEAHVLNPLVARLALQPRMARVITPSAHIVMR